MPASAQTLPNTTGAQVIGSSAPGTAEAATSATKASFVYNATGNANYSAAATQLDIHTVDPRTIKRMEIAPDVLLLLLFVRR